jgi:hypothetical protein
MSAARYAPLLGERGVFDQQHVLGITRSSLEQPGSDCRVFGHECKPRSCQPDLKEDLGGSREGREWRPCSCWNVGVRAEHHVVLAQTQLRGHFNRPVGIPRVGSPVRLEKLVSVFISYDIGPTTQSAILGRVIHPKQTGKNMNVAI